MNTILVKLNVALTEAEALIESLKKQKNEMGLAQVNLDKSLEVLKQKESDFAQRESVIVPIENFNALKKKNEETAAGLQADLADLNDKKKAFEAYKASEMERINNIRIAASKENDNVVAGFQRLSEKEKNLEAEVQKRVNEIVSKLRK